jgi:hypothetical protein
MKNVGVKVRIRFHVNVWEVAGGEKKKLHFSFSPPALGLFFLKKINFPKKVLLARQLRFHVLVGMV